MCGILQEATCKFIKTQNYHLKLIGNIPDLLD